MHEEDQTGTSDCFTRASVVSIRGLPLGWPDQERFGAEAGMIVNGNVPKKCDVLVLGGADSRAGKSKPADDLGVRKIAWSLVRAPLSLKLGRPARSRSQP